MWAQTAPNPARPTGHAAAFRRGVGARIGGWGRVLWPIAYAVIGGAVAVATFYALRDILDVGGTAVLVLLGAAFSILLAQLLAIALVWALLLRQVEPHSWANRAIVVQSFVLGWMGRYLPGVADLAGKYFVCRRGGARPERVRAAILYEQLLQLSVMLALPALTVGFFFPRLAWALTPALLLVSGLLTAAVASRRVMRIALWPVERLLGDGQAPDVVPGPRDVLLPSGLLLVGGVLGALGLHLVAVAMTSWPAEAVGHALFVYGAATLAGYIIPLLPAGAGAREVTIVWLLAPTVGPGPALSVAIVSRAITVVADASLGAGTAAWFSAGHARRIAASVARRLLPARRLRAA